MAAEKQETQKKGEPETIIIGISGPSSSGKTTLARLLRTVFAVHGMKTFIIHEDDFYYPDDRCVLPFLHRCASYLPVAGK